MPYKELKLYWRAWLHLDLRPRITKYLKKNGGTQIQLINKAVDIFLKNTGF